MFTLCIPDQYQHLATLCGETAPVPWVQMDHQGAMCPMFYDSQMNNSTHVNIMNHSQQGGGPLIRFSI